MLGSAGDIFLNLQINPGQLTNQLTGAAQNASKQAANIFSGLGKKIGGLLGTAAAVKFTKDCLDIGSSLSEVQNVVDTAFGSMVQSANEFASNAMENFGMSELSAKKYMGVFGQMSSAMGITGEAALDMAENVTALTGDVASFYNLDTDEAYTKLKSIWTGETEALKDLGVVMTQTNLDQYALNNGFGKTTAKMTEQEKVMLRYQYVTGALSNASGDFLKTQDGWANQTRVLTLRFQQLQATLGQGFISLFTPIVKGLNKCLIGLQKLADGFVSLASLLTGTDLSSSSITGVGDSAAEAAENVAGIGDAASSTAKKIERSLAGFDEINKLSSSSDSGDVSGAGGNTVGTDNVTLSGAGNVEKEIGSFAQKVLDMLDPLKAIRFDNLITSLRHLKEACKPITDKLFSGLEWGYYNIFVPLAQWTIEDYLPAYIDTFASSLKLLNTVLEVLQPVWDTAWKHLFKPLAEWRAGIVIGVLHGISGALDGLAKWLDGHKGTLNEILDNYAAPFFDSVMGLINEFTDLLKNCWNNIIVPLLPVIIPIFENIITTIENWYREFLKALEGIIKILTGVIEFLNGVFTADWNKCLNGLLSILEGIIDTIGGILQGTANNILSLIGTLVKSIGALMQLCWNIISDIFSGTGEWFAGVFNKAWEGICNAFSGVKEFFSGVWSDITGLFKDIGTEIGNAVSGAFKTAINGVFGTIEKTVNGFINMINGVIGTINKIPNVNISKIQEISIPRLAQGGYVKPNTPQLAMIGDNRHQGEVVAPEDKLKQMASEAAQMSNGGVLMAEAVQLLKMILKILQELDLDIQIDGMSIKKYIVNKINENTKATGKCEIIT